VRKGDLRELGTKGGTACDDQPAFRADVGEGFGKTDDAAWYASVPDDAVRGCADDGDRDAGWAGPEERGQFQDTIRLMEKLGRTTNTEPRSWRERGRADDPPRERV
jgi:hypothetical protein